MSRHSFDPQVAEEVGINAAVIYQNIKWWCEKNAANEKNIHDGRAWTFNSMSALEKLFPYLSYDQIRRALEKLVSAGMIEVGNFNKDGRDRTRWFCDLRQLHLASMPDTSGVNARPLPVSKPVINNNPLNPPQGEIPFFSETEEQESQSDPFDDFWDLYPKNERKVAKAKCRKAFDRALAGKNPNQTMPVLAQDLISCVRKYAESDPDIAYVPAPLVWLNQARWEPYLHTAAFSESDLTPNQLKFLQSGKVPPSLQGEPEKVAFFLALYGHEMETA